MRKSPPRIRTNEVGSTYTGYVISRWNSERLKVEYLNQNMCWRNLGYHTLVFQNPKSADRVDIPKYERKRNPIFLCKVFVTRYKQRYCENKYTLTKYNYWHILEGMMNV